MGRAKLHICFVAHNAYGALTGADTGHIGGIEWQQSLMAKWLAKKGYQVSMITWDEGQEDDLVVEGVRALRMCGRDAGIKGLRFFYPKWTSLCRAMRRADADIYYYNCGDQGLGQLAMWCHRHSRRCVYSLSSDTGCDPKRLLLKPRREQVFYKYGLKYADCVIAQTHRQQQMLREEFRIDSTVISMPCEYPGITEYVPLEPPNKDQARVLWVGRISKEKRFEWLLDIAEQCPQIAFDVVGSANTDFDYALALKKRASKIHNVKMHGRVPHVEMAKYYRCSSVLCCTSAYEGFPNTFLEAWSHGIPVVSTFDPDGVIAKHGLGWNASSIGTLVDGLRTAMRTPKKWQAASEAARSYYVENHTVDTAMAKFERIFSGIAKG